MAHEDFLHRSAWATHNGHPLWLWPDVNILEWQEALQNITRISTHIITDGKAGEPLTGEKNAVEVACYTSGLGPLLGYWASRGQLSCSEHVARLIDLQYFHNARRVSRLTQAATSAVERLSEFNVPVVVFKGMHTAFQHFPDPATRPMADIDLWVEPAHASHAGQVLRKLGYVPGHTVRLPDEQFWQHVSSSAIPRGLRYAHEDDPWGIDLHTSANRRYGRGSPIIPLDELIAHAHPGGWHLSSLAKIMPPPAAILFQACHAGCPGNLRLIQLVELVFAIRQWVQSDAGRWEDIVDLGRRTGTARHAYVAISLAAHLAPQIVPDDLVQGLRRDVPQTVLDIADSLTPATAHSILRFSMRERYMWTSSVIGKIIQLTFDVVPAGLPPSKMLPTMRRRFWRLARGGIAF